MNPQTPPSTDSLTHLVRVRAEPPDQFTAELVGLPEIQATAATREEALEQLRHRVGEGLASGELVSLAAPSENPLLRWFGWAKDDPEYSLFREEIQRYRREVDERADREDDSPECSSSSSTPTT
jgi:hypothetical protein